MSDSNLHATESLPVMLVGHASGALKGGRHIRYPANTPLANLHLTMLDMFGIPGVERMGDSTGRLQQLTIG
jgi:hypothetical protein